MNDKSIHYKRLLQQMKNSQLSVDFIICSMNCILHPAQNKQTSNNFLQLLSSLYDSFLIHKKQLSSIFQKVQLIHHQKQKATKLKEFLQVKQDFSLKLQSLQILVFQRDFDQLLERINQYKKDIQKGRQQDESSFFQQSNISKQGSICSQFQDFDKLHKNLQENIKQKLKEYCSPYNSNENDNHLDLIFRNVKIRQTHSVECFLQEQLQKAIQKIQDEKTQFQKKQQIWLQYLEKFQNDNESFQHVNIQEVFQAIETFRTEIITNQSNRQSGIQQLIQIRLNDDRNYNLQTQKWHSPVKNHIETETNQIKSHKSRNKSQIHCRSNYLTNKKNFSKSLMKPSNIKQNKQPYKQNFMQKQRYTNVICNQKEVDKSNKKEKSRNNKLKQVQVKIAKKLCLNKYQRTGKNFQTDKKVPMQYRLKNDKSSQKKTVKKTLVSFCF